jgi:hypothetical protein
MAQRTRRSPGLSPVCGHERDEPVPGGDVNATVSRPAAVALLIAVDATLVWAGIVLVGPDVMVPVMVAIAAGTVATLTIGGSFRARETAAWAAIREHGDPGSEVRSEADAQARRLLDSLVVDRWGPPVLLFGLAVACVVTAARPPTVGALGHEQAVRRRSGRRPGRDRRRRRGARSPRGLILSVCGGAAP